MDDVSGYGTADSCSDKTPPYLPTSRTQQQQPFDTSCRDEVRNEFSMGTRPMRVSRRTIMLQYNRLFLLNGYKGKYIKMFPFITSSRNSRATRRCKQTTQLTINRKLQCHTTNYTLAATLAPLFKDRCSTPTIIFKIQISSQHNNSLIKHQATVPPPQRLP